MAKSSGPKSSALGAKKPPKAAAKSATKSATKPWTPAEVYEAFSRFRKANPEPKGELEHLVSVERKEIIKKIKETREYGDLSENAEYDAAREQQSMIEGRIEELEALLKKAKVIDENPANHDKVVAPNLTPCSNCNEPVLSHRVCPSCGYYKGKSTTSKES